MSSCLLVAISGHGFGHLAQVAPILNRLYRELPDLRLVIRSALSRERLEKRLAVPFELQLASDDFGMLQHTALQVDVAASLERYREFHERWVEQVSRVAAELAMAEPDLVFADVPYLTLAAAKAAGIPALAMCSLNWLDIFDSYCGSEPGAETILAQMREAYTSAEVFLRCEPAMPMPGLGNVRDIGLVSAAAINRRDELERAGWLKPHELLVVIGMGGIDHRLPMERWPRYEGVHFIVPQAWGIEREDCHAIEGSHFSFADLLASSDAVITKPGYGTFADAASSGVPVIYVERQDGWPEQSHLIAWLRQNTHCCEVERKALENGDIGPVLLSVFAQGRYPAVAAQGVGEAVAELRKYLV